MIKKIDTLTAIELENILKIWLTANCDAHPFIPEAYWQGNLAFVREQLPQADLYVYCENNEIIAFLGMNAHYIAGIFVKNGYRSRGIGQKLLNEAKHAHDTLSLSVYAKNQNAVTFYEKQGFKQLNQQIDEHNELEYQLVWKK
ncbi:GNAT family N-acetyltransferase [Enterococcus plantarum]|uniref:GNAT family N-acetyltransferase n=1 Tax=Enterococcus plantarum TaxID=1077675 RepID=A0A2W4BER9_9ENTE|nr:GNAT family N-acetyltransferase [Enterococcus plantarum]MBO0421382.1 GNAT family N-acetyltransferase [Enterococcus plantarum]MBO0467573.1 GNAT family N-acetyltransferase [Enterococcus plantarum]OEG14733.1 GNAT family N-acetyltransferase [Enterococcus plantarum]PZL75205.1 GNAT family N-acetyltransferase [Enterococcus plantarum]